MEIREKGRKAMFINDKARKVQYIDNMYVDYHTQTCVVLVFS